MQKSGQRPCRLSRNMSHGPFSPFREFVGDKSSDKKRDWRLRSLYSLNGRTVHYEKIPPRTHVRRFTSGCNACRSAPVYCRYGRMCTDAKCPVDWRVDAGELYVFVRYMSVAEYTNDEFHLFFNKKENAQDQTYSVLKMDDFTVIVPSKSIALADDQKEAVLLYRKQVQQYRDDLVRQQAMDLQAKQIQAMKEQAEASRRAASEAAALRQSVSDLNSKISR